MNVSAEPIDIDWVFCWRTCTGQVRRGTRDTTYNGKRVPYQPGGRPPTDGMRTVVRGRLRQCTAPPVGPRWDEQGSISRMGCFVWGYVHHAILIPASDLARLGVLQDAARKAIAAGTADEWALAAIQVSGRVIWAIHVDAPRPVISGLAALVDAPWTLEVGADIHCLDRDGHVISTLPADALFDSAALPPLAGLAATS